MEKLTRRGLIKRASIGAGATGLLAAAVAAGAVGARIEAMPTASAHSAVKTPDPTDPLMVFVTDASTLVVMNGEQAVTVKNASLAQSLLTLK
ncbi:MAG: hypothetical protein ABI234_05200 [Ktedonobacteraceae bacterium]